MIRKLNDIKIYILRIMKRNINCKSNHQSISAHCSYLFHKDQLVNNLMTYKTYFEMNASMCLKISSTLVTAAISLFG